MQNPENENHRSQAIRLSLEGDFNRALRHLQAALGENPNDRLLVMERRMVQAASGDLTTEEELKSGFGPTEADSKVMSRFYAGHAFLNYAHGRQEEGKADLVKALSLDEDSALCHNSIARHYLFIEGDVVRAEHHLEAALHLSPNALSPCIDLINLDAERHEFKKALNRARRLLCRNPFNPKAWMAFMVSAFLAAPWSGRSTIIPIAFLMFVPYIGPTFLGFWILFCIVAYSSLRRTHGAIATTPTVMLGIVVPSFAFRWLLLGRIWP